MTRITVAITEEQEKFIRSEKSKHGNQSSVIRHAIDELQKQKMIRDMQEHFRNEPRRKKHDGLDRLAYKALKDLPEY